MGNRKEQRLKCTLKKQVTEKYVLFEEHWLKYSLTKY